jgi:hypothetical protein
MNKFIPITDTVSFDPTLELKKQPTREVILSVYSKPVYEFCNLYNTTHPEKTTKNPTGYEWNHDASQYYLMISSGKVNDESHYINLNLFTWFHKLIATEYIKRYYKQYTPTGGRRSKSSKPSKKRLTARRRPSSKARKARKSRTTRRR